MSELSITERQTELYSNDNRPCKRYNKGSGRNSVIQDSFDFMECSRREIWKLLKPQINCSIVGLEPFFDHFNELSQCQTEVDAKITLDIFNKQLYKSQKLFWINVCTLPCIQVSQLMKTS